MGTTINGVPYDYGCIEVGAAGLVLTGIRSIDYGNEVEREYVQGAGREPLGQTPGQLKPKAASMTVTKSTQIAFLAQLGDGYMFKTFPITVSYGFEGQPLVKDQLLECTIVDDGDSHSQGASALEATIGLMVTKCIKNGLNPAKGTPGIGGSSAGGEGFATG